ncbi:MAG: AAA family ATPase, partial [Mariniblastus sp.]
RGDDQTLKMWEMVAEENGCLSKPYEFANDHARFLFHRGRLDNLHYSPHEDFRCKMTIMCGLPGAGKDTWLARHRPELPVVSLDAIRQKLKVDPTNNQGVVVQEARTKCRELLRSNSDFAFNATNTTKQVRKLWVDLGADYNARIELVYVEPKLKTLLDQNKNRDDRIPVKVIERLIEKLDVPTAAECHGLQISN